MNGRGPSALHSLLHKAAFSSPHVRAHLAPSTIGCYSGKGQVPYLASPLQRLHALRQYIGLRLIRNLPI